MTCSSKAIESGVPTVYLSFTSGLPAAQHGGVMMRDQLIAEHPEAELHAVDTYLASVAEALLVYEALNQRDNWHDGAPSWPRGPRRRALPSTPSSWSTIWNRQLRRPHSQHCCSAGAKLDAKPLPEHQHRGKLALMGVARGRKKGIRQPRVLLEAQ